MISWIVSTIVAVIALVILAAAIVLGEDIVDLPCYLIEQGMLRLPKYVRKALIALGVALFYVIVIAVMLAGIVAATIVVHAIIY